LSVVSLVRVPALEGSSKAWILAQLCSPTARQLSRAVGLVAGMSVLNGVCCQLTLPSFFPRPFRLTSSRLVYPCRVSVSSGPGQHVDIRIQSSMHVGEQEESPELLIYPSWRSSDWSIVTVSFDLFTALLLTWACPTCNNTLPYTPPCPIAT